MALQRQNLHTRAFAAEERQLPPTTIVAGTITTVIGGMTTTSSGGFSSVINAGGTVTIDFAGGTVTAGGTTTITTVGGTMSTTTTGGTTTTAPDFVTTPGAILTNPVFGTGDLDKPFSAGVRTTIGYTVGDSPYQAEFSYFTLNQWDTSAAAFDPNGMLVSPFTNFGQFTDPFGTLDRNQLVTIHELSYLDNAEFNIKTLLPTPPGMTFNFLMGVRYMGVREELDYLSFKNISAPATAAVTAHTVNNMWGPQVGALVDFNVERHTWISFEIKGAILSNSASRDLFATTNSTNYTHDDSQTATAFASEFNLSIFWKPTPALSARIGYEAILVNNLVLAEENFAPSAPILESSVPIPLNNRGSVLYQGPYAGLELDW
jgi:hypothetical protein